MPYQLYDTGWIRMIYSTACLGWFLLSTGLLPWFTLYSCYNNVYNPFATMMSAVCDFIGRTIISTGIHVIHFESIIFNKFDYIQPIYNVIKYVESFLPHLAVLLHHLHPFDIFVPIYHTSLDRRGRQTKFYFSVLNLRRILHAKFPTLSNILTLPASIIGTDTLHTD
jgi:hypothetical protein